MEGIARFHEMVGAFAEEPDEVVIGIETDRGLFVGALVAAGYNSLRNTNEGMNGYIKDPAHEALDDPGRRRIHGVGAQSVLVAFQVLAANVRKIRTFIFAAPAGTPGRRKRPRRQTTEPLTAWRPTMPKAAVSGDPDPPLLA